MNAESANFLRRRMRSKLFVPASRSELFSKAIRSAADAVAFDLEDSVLPEQKPAARVYLRDFLQQNIPPEKVVVVRTNSTRSDGFTSDLSAAIWPGVALVNLPKTEDPAEIYQLSEALSMLERERGIVQPIGILPTIETPRGLRQAHAIAAADARVAGLQLGLIDLLSSLDISSQDAVVQHVRLELRLAAGEAGLPCFDSAFSNIADLEGFTADAIAARSLGFSGKSCIHPSQIASANQVFSPTAEEIATARRIVDKAREASAKGRGAFVFDGRMMDEPLIRHAEEILQHAAGMLEENS
jgi:citrate lyase subunit beta / citryl-CoA lyase